MPKTTTIEKVCAYLRNWFDKAHKIGKIKISGGVFESDYEIKDGQYFRIVGSTMNDGVYLSPCNTLVDEEFDGAVWLMALPQSFVEVLDKIDEWEAKYATIGGVNMSPFSSESFGGYSYSKSAGGAGDTTKDKSGTWLGAFGGELSRWRKI